MSIVPFPEKPVDLLPLLLQVRHLVFDLNSLKDLHSKESWDSIKQILNIFVERDFQLTLLWESEDYPVEWRNRKEIVVISTAKQELELLFQNAILFSSEHFWITENAAIQKYLLQHQVWFASSTSNFQETSRVHFEHFQDLLELFNPSRHTAILVGEKIVQLKKQAPAKPLIIGIGGPEECGHAYFVEKLVDELEKHHCLVEGIDLTAVTSTEFHSKAYWRSPEIEQWVMEQVLLPFVQGKCICIETPPALMKPYETNVYPFFLAPEMILVIWGNTLFLKSLQKIIHWSILLELSAKVATARLFGIDEREEFDPDFIRKYEEHDGRLYEDYLKKHSVREIVKQRVDFNNFLAFRPKI